MPTKMLGTRRQEFFLVRLRSRGRRKSCSKFAAGANRRPEIPYVLFIAPSETQTKPPPKLPALVSTVDFAILGDNTYDHTGRKQKAKVI